jgi:uncharacterized protein YqfA (UPF0365 family)
MTTQVVSVILIAVAIAILVVMVLFLSFIRIWIKAMTSGVPISLIRIIGMKLRGNPAELLIDTHIILTKQQNSATLDETEYTYMENRNRVRSSDDLIRLVKEKKGQRR